MDPVANDVRVDARHVRWRPCEHVLVILKEGGQLYLLI